MNARVNKIQVGGYTFIGYSLAGEESVIGVPELNVCFDIGRSPSEIINIDNVLLTHGHMDHAAGIAYYFSQRNFLDMPDGNLVVPKDLVQPIHKLMDAWRDVEGHRTPYHLIGMSPNEEYVIRRGLVARTFQTIHGGPCLGYSVIEIRQKLKPEFLDIPGPKLAEIRRSGTELTYNLEVPLVCYCGDTAYGDFFNLDWVRKAKVLILECTFVEQDHRTRAVAGYHLHLDDFLKLQDTLENEFILLVHLSRRTSLAVARQELRSCLSDEKFKRLHFLMARTPTNRPHNVNNSIQ
ncbi:MAG: MBL fold metallo-hydrolase [Phycisphaerae bacterium]